MLLGLPVELIVAIFEYLDAPDLLHCQLVNGELHEMITYTSSLRYKIELYAEHMVDNPYHSLGKGERLRLLLRRQEAWRDLRLGPGGCSKVEINSTDHLVNFSEDWIGLTSLNNVLKFERSGSRLMGIPGKSWSLEDIDLEIRGFGFDVGQDLVVLVEEPQIDILNSNETFRIHCLSLGTGKPHGLAIRPVKEYSTGLVIDEWDCVVRIYGSYIGVLLQPDNFISVANILFIWDWVHDVTMLVYTGTGYIENFAFVDDHKVMLPVCHDDDPTLRLSVEVLDFTSGTLPQGVMLCRLWLVPDQDYGDYPLTVMAAPNSKPAAHSPTLSYPFSWDAEDRLIVIGNAPNHNKERLTIFMFRSQLESLIRYSPPNVEIPWESWAYSGPCIATYTMPRSGFHEVCGSRVILPFRHESERGFYLLDFNQRNLRRRIPSPGSRHEGFYRFIDRRSPLSIMCLDQTVYLPEIEGIFDYDGYALSEMGIITTSRKGSYYLIFPV